MIAFQRRRIARQYEVLQVFVPGDVVGLCSAQDLARALIKSSEDVVYYSYCVLAAVCTWPA